MAPGKDLWMFCGLEERFVGSSGEIRVWGSLEEDFQEMGFWGAVKKVWRTLGCTWVEFAGIHDTCITFSEERLLVFGDLKTGFGNVL